MKSLPIPAFAVVTLIWLVALAVLVLAPEPSSQPGELMTKNAIRLALAYYGIAAWLMLGLSREGWAARTRSGSLARYCWSLGWLTYIIHLGFAFHYYHHWSHADAVARTERISGFGPGIYLSHFFTLIWTMDVAWWWLWPDSYARRSRWLDGLLHGFMLFMIFNATLIFVEEEFIRFFGVALLSLLALRWLMTRYQPGAPATGA